MLERILLVLAIGLGMALVLGWIIRRSAGRSSTKARGEPRIRTPGPASTPSLRAAGSLPPSVRSSSPDQLVAAMNGLVGVGGDVQGKTFHVGNRTGTIGRGLGNFVQTTDDDASRVHVQFMPVPGGLQLKDMGSSNGTFVNGERIQITLLRDGDEIRIGKARFQYKARGEFAIDFVLDRKAAGARVAQETHMANASDIRSLLRQAMESSNGDVEVAAQIMGVKPEHLRSMLQQYGMEAAGPKHD